MAVSVRNLGTSRDPQTGLLNEEVFRAVADHVVRQALRYQECLTLIRYELQHLREISQAFGRRGYDGALLEFAEILRGSLRKSDVVGRLGEESYAALLPRTSSAQADVVIRHVSTALAERNDRNADTFRLMMRTGRTTMDPSVQRASITQLLAEAEPGPQATRARARLFG
ncbi:MAG TPA: diguanylate cyclase [Acidimicrobiales bacterium]|nr:diguanylate cyclase [Acidimicrobiales bacterium]